MRYGSAHPYLRHPSSFIIAAVLSYASRTHSTILSGSGEYSSSMLTAPSKPVSRIGAEVGEIARRRGRGAGRRGPCRRSRRCGRGRRSALQPRDPRRA